MLEKNVHSQLELIVLPTEECNFRCTYCYEDFQIGRMDAAVVSNIKRLVERRAPDLSSFRYSWFGGEPLLAHDTITELCEHAINVCSQESIAFVDGSVTTNGYGLSMKLATRLVHLRQRYFQVTLDGDEAEHNLTRKHQSNRNSFGQIMRNIKALRDSDLNFEMLLRVHIRADNIESVRRLLEQLNCHFLTDARFKVHLKPIGNYGGPNKESIDSLVLTNNSSQVLEDLNKSLRDRPDSAVGAVKTVPANAMCYASNPQSFVIRANGQVNKCTVALDDERNLVGHLREGGVIEFNVERFEHWMEGHYTADAQTIKCPYTYVRTLPREGGRKVINISAITA